MASDAPAQASIAASRRGGATASNGRPRYAGPLMSHSAPRIPLEPADLPADDRPGMDVTGHVEAPRDAEPPSRCVRCGEPTPAGVSLCERDNPGGIKSPSATQVHGTMLLGVGIGVLFFLLLARLAVGHNGPFVATIAGSTPAEAAGQHVVIRVANQGAAAAFATCRVTRDGSPRPDDVVFRTARVPAAGSVDAPELLPASQDPAVPDYDVAKLTIACT